MEDLLTQISKDAAPAKFSTLRKACNEAIDFLSNEDTASTAPVYLLREKCLSPLQLAMESHSHKLATSAIGGLQKILQESRFHSPMEEEEEQHWLPMQILKVVSSAPNLSEDTQVEVMKILLNMTFSTAWCMNARVITRITEVCMQVFSGNHISARPAVKATLVQLLSSFAEKMKSVDVIRPEEEAKDAIAEFSMNGQKETVDHLAQDIVAILKYLCDKLGQSSSSVQARNAVPLILEGIHAILNNVPASIRQVDDFLDVVWQNLCPTLIVIIGNPKLDKSITSQKTASQDEVGRGSGCSQTAPALLGPSAKTVYSIAVELVRLVGAIGSMRPVLESLFHRILLYPPIQHRLEALKAMKELLNDPDRLISLAGPAEDDDSKIAGKVRKTHSIDTALIKLLVDSMQESCHCSDSATCITAVSNIDTLLKTVENIAQGKVLSESQATELIERYKEKDKGTKHMDIQDKDPSTTANQSSVLASKPVAELHPDGDKSTKQGYHNLSSQIQVRQRHSDQIERESAKEFMRHLTTFLPSVKNMYSGPDMDEALMNLASRFCADQQQIQSTESGGGLSTEVAILNADAVYVATYTALSFSLKLSQCQYYESSEKPVPPSLSEEQFNECILGEGLLLYVSPSWLSELYNQVLQVDLMKLIESESSSANMFTNLIIDLDGLHSRKIGGQLLTGCSSNTSDIDTDTHNVSTEAGMLLTQRILTSCWEGILDVLSVLLTGKSSCGITSSFALMLGTEGAKEETLKAREAICMSLDGLQRAARLACTLGMQSRCGKIFALLAKASCVLEEEQQQRAPKLPSSTEPKPAQVNLSKPKPPRLHAAHALSMDLILNMGLEMGSHASDCWKHVFRCCNHIAELERLYFTRSNQGKPKPSSDVVASETLGDPNVIPGTFSGTFTSIQAAICVPSSKSVSDIIKQSGVAAGWDSAMTGGAVLSTSQSTEVLCALSQQVDRLFDDAARKLNMKSVVEYLGALSSASHSQLFGKKCMEEKPHATLLVDRLGDVMLEVLKSERPLYSVMKAWNRVAVHFVEAACHSEGRIAKKAVTCLHDCVTLRLSSYPELPHFHFNEALCKPFENLLCLDMCDGDVQDQIICSICELVEACASEIKSGWRPLFGALRAVKIEYTVNEEINDARQRHVSAVLDVFEVFLDTDNVWVFAHAAVDCILCLLKYVRGPGEFEDLADSDSDSDSEMVASVPDAENLVLPALRYLKRCCSLLSSMWTMPACPVFSGAHRIQLNPNPQSIDPVIPDMDFAAFQQYFNSLSNKQPAQRVNSSLKQEYNEKDLDLFTPTRSSEGNEHITNDAKPDFDKTESDDINDKSTEKKIDPNKEESDVCQKGMGEGDYVSDKELELVNDSDTSSGYSLPTVGDRPHRPLPDDSDSDPDEESTRKRVNYNANASQSFPSPTIDYVPVGLELMDNHTGLLHVWFLVLEGLTNAVSACPKNYQPQTLETLFDLLRDASNTPGCEFSTHCLNHLLLPMLQGWLRKGGQYRSFWETTATNFKQCCGLCTDLVVELIVQFTASPEATPNLEFLLKQMLDVLIECISQSVETISRLGCACIRHIFLSGGPLFTEPMWHIATTSLLRAFDVTMYSLRQLMVLFEASSDNFYGDIGQVKVAARKDSTPAQCERLRQLARQVFLLDSQQACLPTQSAVDDDKSYVFLLYPPGCENSLNPEHIAMRVPLRSIVLSLLSHQLLLQTVGYVLLQGTHIYTQSELQLLPGLNADTDSQNPHKLPGMLHKLSTRNVLVFLQCLDESYRFACDFNSRPGLKFLIQKVINSSVASNLYKSAGASMTFCLHTLLEICLYQGSLTLKKTRSQLESCDPLENGEVQLEDRMEGHDVKDENLACSRSKYDLDRCSNEADPIEKHFDLFVQKLHQRFAEICQKYIELVLDKEGTTSADRISDRPLFFLVSQLEDLPSLKREKALSEIVAEKLKQQEQQEMGSFMTTAVTQIQDSQGNNNEAEKEVDEEEEDRPGAEKNPDKVYQVATDVTIQSVISTYKKRKQQKTLPSFVKFTKEREKTKMKKKQLKDGVDPEIEKQQNISVMKDAEAHKESWTEMICMLLYLLQQLPEQDFHALLPVVFHWTNQLICHVENQKLKDTIAKWLYKVGHMNGWVGLNTKLQE